MGTDVIHMAVANQLLSEMEGPPDQLFRSLLARSDSPHVSTKRFLPADAAASGHHPLRLPSLLESTRREENAAESQRDSLSLSEEEEFGPELIDFFSRGRFKNALRTLPQRCPKASVEPSSTAYGAA